MLRLLACFPTSCGDDPRSSVFYEPSKFFSQQDFGGSIKKSLEKELEDEIPIDFLEKNNTLDLMVIRLLKDGSTAMAKPCYDCLPIIQLLDIRYVYYTNYQGELVRELASEMTTQHRCSGHLARLYRITNGIH